MHHASLMTKAISPLSQDFGVSGLGLSEFTTLLSSVPILLGVVRLRLRLYVGR